MFFFLIWKGLLIQNGVAFNFNSMTTLKIKAEVEVFLYTIYVSEKILTFTIIETYFIVLESRLSSSIHHLPRFHWKGFSGSFSASAFHVDAGTLDGSEASQVVCFSSKIISSSDEISARILNAKRYQNVWFWCLLNKNHRYSGVMPLQFYLLDDCHQQGRIRSSAKHWENKGSRWLCFGLEKKFRLEFWLLRFGCMFDRGKQESACLNRHELELCLPN